MWLFGLTVGAVILILSARYCVNHYVDLPVYWYASRSLLSGRRDLYAPTFVWGGYDPLMDYRYPPLFLLTFVPLGLLPYTMTGYVWFALKFVALVFTLRSIYRMLGGEIKNKVLFWSIPFLIATPYVLQEFRYGNVHFFIIFLIVLALYLFEVGSETLSASALALSITIKAFPAFFLPYFFVKRKFRYVALTLLFVALFNLLPAFYFGFKENFVLLKTWYDHALRNREFHEFHNGMNHSLKGILQRYLSHIPYEKRLRDPDYPNINLANLTPTSLQAIWYAVTGLVLLLIAFLCLRHGSQESREDRILIYGLIACSIVAFAPWTGYNYLVMLILPSAVISAYLLRHRAERRARTILVLVAVAVLLSFVPPLIPGRAIQRAMQVYSPYFFSTLALFMSFVVALAPRRFQSGFP